MPGHRRNLLDPDELRVARGFILRAAFLVVYAVTPSLSGPRPAAEVAARLVAAFTMGGTLAIVIALLRADTAGRGKLNRWDEAMAFNGLSLLIHLLLRLSRQA